jgi:uncharacterized protein
MKFYESKLLVSPRDLIAELECGHRLHLEWAVLKGLLPEPEKVKNEELELLIKHGVAHEANLANQFAVKEGFRKIPSTFEDKELIESAYRKTLEAMEDGAETIYTPTLFNGEFVGYPDFLIKARDDEGKAFLDGKGRFIYDPVDAKSARSEKRAAVLQVAAYAFAMGKMGLPRPNKVHLWLANDKQWSTNASDVIDLGELFYSRAVERINSFKELVNQDWEAPRESCSRCRWETHCDKGRRAADDLSIIQGIRSTTRLALIDVGIRTLSDMANAEDHIRTAGRKEIAQETFENLRAQAAIQIKGRDISSGIPIYEVREKDGFGLIPQPSPGDIWFDMEGDPYAEIGEGLEYMFGYVLRDGEEFVFKTFDAEDRLQERVAFGKFIEFVNARRAAFPQMHIYHYASYEPTALLRLAQRHGFMEYEVDKLVREGVFVDLYSIVRKTLRFSTESLSIKKIEPVFYEGNRDKKVSSSIGSVVAFEDALSELRDGNRPGFEKILDEIKAYNEDDCRSTQRLDQWLREQARLNNVDFAKAKAAAEEKWKEEDDGPKEPIALQLLKEVPTKREERTEFQQGKAMVAAAIEYHRREDRPAWWAIFEKATSETFELENANDVVYPKRVECTEWHVEGRKLPRREITFYANDGIDLRHILDFEHIPQALYEFAPSGFKVVSGSTRGFREVQIIELEADKVIVEERASKSGTWNEVPFVLLPGAPIPTFVIQKILRQVIGQGIIDAETLGQIPFPNSSHNDILLRRLPRQKSGKLPQGLNDVESVTQALIDSDFSYVAVQGPPGTGKTYVGANVIVNLVRLGWKIGVVAQSHAVIENLLNSVRKIDANIPIAKKAQSSKSQAIYHVDDVADWAATQQAGFVIGGTTWNYASAGLRSLGLDLMVIDEAGQYSLANSLVSLSCASRALLLGDPQQLPHVSQGKHPEPIDNSVLKHVLGENKTIPASLGYFLARTYRLHPRLAEPVSRLQYEDRLSADERCARRNLSEVLPGLHVVDVAHAGNTTRSIEEVTAIVERIKNLIGLLWIDTDAAGTPMKERPIGQKDILVIAAYNNQVRLIKQNLSKEGLSDIKVGTIDKFQGQEAAVVLISMATSSSEDLPRGIEFLLSPNRLNVAISRAQWACFLVRSPELSVMEPSSADGMVMLGKFITLCRGDK